MKLYHCYGVRIDPGFPLKLDADRPYVPMGNGIDDDLADARIPLADPLVEKIRAACFGGLLKLETIRIMHSDIENRSQLWLVAESPEGRNDALVILTWWYWDLIKKTSTVLKLTDVNPDVEILDERRVAGRKNTIGHLGVGFSALLRMPLGTACLIDQETTATAGLFQRWNHNLKERNASKWRVAFSDQGELSILETKDA